MYQVGAVVYSICTSGSVADFDEYKRIPHHYSDEFDMAIRLLLGSMDTGKNHSAKKVVDILEDLTKMRASAMLGAKQERKTYPSDSFLPPLMQIKGALSIELEEVNI